MQASPLPSGASVSLSEHQELESRAHSNGLFLLISFSLYWKAVDEEVRVPSSSLVSDMNQRTALVLSVLLGFISPQFCFPIMVKNDV